jgi:Ca2+-binding EF-hand superfamily protein
VGNKKTLMKTICILTASLCLLGLATCLTPAAAKPEGIKGKKDGPKAKFFEKYDKNHNGVIDPDEREAIRKDFAEQPDGDLKRFDINKDGKLDDKEIAAVTLPTGQGKNAGVAAFFAKYDKNNNCIIDAGEMDAIRKDYAAKPDGDLKKFDKDKDGKLNDEEIAAIQLSTGKKSGDKAKKTGKSADQTEKTSPAPHKAEKAGGTAPPAKPDK